MMGCRPSVTSFAGSGEDISDTSWQGRALLLRRQYTITGGNSAFGASGRNGDGQQSSAKFLVAGQADSVPAGFKVLRIAFEAESVFDASDVVQTAKALSQSLDGHKLLRSQQTLVASRIDLSCYFHELIGGWIRAVQPCFHSFRRWGDLLRYQHRA